MIETLRPFGVAQVYKSIPLNSSSSIAIIFLLLPRYVVRQILSKPKAK